MTVEIMLIEANSVRLRIDPAELRKDSPKLDRIVSKAGSVKKFSEHH